MGGGTLAMNQGTCTTISRLPIPYDAGNAMNPVAPYAQQYANMMSALKVYVKTIYPSVIFSVIKLGSALDSNTAEMTLLGGNQNGSSAYQFLYPPEVGQTTGQTNTCPLTEPSATGTASYSSVWHNSYAYNPRYVELTWEAIANNIGTLFNNSADGTATLLDLDVHGDISSTLPFISFQETNTKTNTIYTLGSGGSYDYRQDGPNIQDDIVFCDLLGMTADGTTVTVPVNGTGATAIAGPYNAGFFGSISNHYLTGSRMHAHQPLNFSYPAYQWGIEQDGLLPISDATVPGVYAQGAASFGLELSWGTNQSSMSTGGALCGNDGPNSDGSCSSAKAQTTICNVASNGSSTTCSDALMIMLESGLFQYNGTLPYGPGNGTGQLYVMFMVDLCTPHLWQGLSVANAAITGSSLTAGDLDYAASKPNYYNFYGKKGTFDANGTYTLNK